MRNTGAGAVYWETGSGRRFIWSEKDSAGGWVLDTVWTTGRRYSPFVWEGGVVRGRLGPPAMKIDRERVWGKII